jgi:fatty-acyl-CoA synthase
VKFVDKIKREFTFIKRLLRILGRINDISATSYNLVCDDFERAVDQHANNVALLCEGRSLTYAQVDQMANRYAHWALEQNLKIGDTVAVVLPNRLEYFPIWLGFNKVGVITALINNALTGPSLAHCLNISGAGTTIVDLTTRQAFIDAMPHLHRRHNLWALDLRENEETETCRSLDRATKSVSLVRPDRAIRTDLTAHHVALYIYTSGTTGLPKAAKISNARAQLYMRAFAGVVHMQPRDRLYMVLPMYHSTGGLCGMGAALLNGASVFIRKRFSATHFWPDVKRESITHLVYIGELCRYLINSPPAANLSDETEHKLKFAFGNGMRPEVWSTFQKRFNIPYIIEFYGSTEGNVSLFNLDGQPGAVGRVPPYVKKSFNVRLVRFDVESEMPERRLDGLCYECKPGEIGEAIGEIGGDARHAYSGYADKAASEKKILRDVFKKDDSWFRTGDLMRQDKEGYLYFVDRIGDTFRFKGENVSTSEIAEQAASVPGVDEAIVYGVPVPHTDGKAGMAALIIGPEFDLKVFGDYMCARLATYARPRFVRILTHVETTGTFKYKKMDLVKDGIDPATVSDALYYLNGESYVPLTPELSADITEGRIRV